MNAYKHLIRSVLLNPSSANRKNLEAVVGGSEFVCIIERKWKGTDDADAFLCLGIDVGLTGSSSTWDSKEADGVEVFELASEDGFEEPKKVRTVLQTDYATTATAFGNKWAQA